MIKKEGKKYVLYSKDGSKKLGTFGSEKEAKDREKEINAIKHSALVEVSLDITKASIKDNIMRWLATCSDTEKDKTNQATSLQLFSDWIERAESGKALPWLPPPRTPFLGLSHYPDLEGYGEAGLTDKMYVEGKQFKAGGTFHGDTDHPLGKALFEAVRKEKALIEKGEAIEQPIRISAGWWDISHAHGDFIFERKSLDDPCPMCANGGDDKVYLKGQLDHFAATRVPINPRTALALEEKAMTTRKQDAESIVEDPELVEELDERARLTGKSETEEELPPAMVTRGDDEPDTQQMMDDDEMRHMPFGGATSLADAQKYMAAQEQVDQVYSEWAMFRTVMGNILDASEPGEIKGRVSGLVKEFSSRVDAIKASVEDVYLTQSYGGTPMTEQVKQEPVNQPPETFDLQATVDEALNNAQLNRQQKAEAIQEALNTYGEVLKGQLDKVAPPDPNEQVNKAILEQLQLLNAKIGGTAQQPAQQPVQKSLMPDGSPVPTQENQLPVSSVTGKPSALRAMIERSVRVQ